MKFFKKSISFVCILCFSFLLFSQETVRSYEFVNQNLDEIIYALSLNEGITIVSDHTVTGKGSFRFVGSDFLTAFKTFLENNRLYVKEKDSVWTVSKIKIESKDDTLFAIDCFDCNPSVLFEKLSLETSIPIVYDVLPTNTVSVHFTNVSLSQAIELTLMGLGAYSVQDNGSYIAITRKSATPQYVEELTGIADFIIIQEKPQLYEAHIIRADASHIFSSLFSCAGKEFINFSNKNMTIEKVDLYGKSLDELLDLLSLQLDCRYVIEKDFYYILPSDNTTTTIRNTGKDWTLFTLKYKTSQEIVSLFTARFAGLQTIVSDTYSFFSLCTKKEKKEIEDFLTQVDKENQVKILSLEYIKASEFLKNIPPFITAEDFRETGDDTKLFFIGTEEKFNFLLTYLPIVDVPVKRITYDLLIIQYQQTSASSWSPSLQLRPVQFGDALLANAELGSVMDLQFNVLSSFGLTFAAQLNAALSENKAKVFADTRLHGISGSAISFQNTSTYRYRDTALDPETGKPVYTGVTREIISGLMLDIEGWVSGDGMVTTKVSASVSKRGADVSSTIGNPPPTYEKLITTEVRSRNREPVVLSGLVQDDSVLVQSKTPFLSKIPLIGSLFKSESQTNEKTEMVIYLIPHLDYEEQDLESFFQLPQDKNKALERNKLIYLKYIEDIENDGN